MLFKRVTIIGPGLIGASMGMALREKGLSEEVIGVGRRESSLDMAIQAGAIDRATLDLREGVTNADMVVLATGITTSLRLGLQAFPHLKEGCILTDVASTKSFLINGLEGEVPAGVSYVSAHPMAGSEQKGASAAKADLFQRALCLLTRTKATRGDAFLKIEQLWREIGCRTREIDAEEHDILLAQISHLPHIVSSCLVNLVSEEGMELSAGGFRDTTRIASGDPEIWRDICLTNSECLSKTIRSYVSYLEDFEAKLLEGDSAGMEALLEEAKRKRDLFYSG